MNIYEKLTVLQNELNAPKNQYNSFGKYSYRSCEDILIAVKPLLEKYKLSLNISDEIKVIGDRFYIEATATLTDSEKSEDKVINKAFAREELQKKGMDGSQVSGASSSYARKYALNGLFLIDDNKDADTNEYRNQQSNGSNQQNNKQFKCMKCGIEIKPIKAQSGQIMSPEEVLRRTGGICLNCFNKNKAEANK